MANTATSMYFDGTNDYIQFPDNTCDLGNTDFTIEMWINVVATETNAGLFTTNGTSSQPGFHIADTGSNTWKIVAGNSTNWNVFDDVNMGTFATGVWEHWAFVVTNGSASPRVSARGFKNGELQASVRGGTDVPFTLASSGARLGHWTAGGQYINAYIDEFRISKVARYGNFDTPTAPLNTSQSAGRGKNNILPHHVKILAQANSSTTTTDLVKNQTGFIAAAGPDSNPSNLATFSQTQTQFGNCAIYFSGTTGLNFPVAASSDLDWSGNWSYEAWVYSTHTGSSYKMWWGQSAGGNPGTNNAWFFQLHPANQTGGLYVSGNGTNEQYTESLYHTTHDTNRWQHWAMGIVDDNWYIFKDGELFMKRPTSSTYRPAQSTRPFFIGRNEAGTSIFEGYMDNIRLCCGESAYTPHFTPYGGQKNVVHNRGGAVTDARLASANTHAIQTGRAAIGSDPATNANTYSLDFDGTDDYLVHKTGSGTGTTQFRPGDDRGTIFAWIYPDVVNSHGGIFSAGYTGDTNTYFDFYLSSGAKLGMQQREGSPAGGGVVGDTSLTATTWQSVAVVSDGTAWALYVNGTAQSLTASGAPNTGEWFADTPNLNNITIGTLLRTSDADNFDGKIAQVAYFGSNGLIGTSSGVLTAAQIAALHSAGKSHDLTTATGVYTASEIDDLKGYWRMGNHYLDTAETIYDASGNGYDMQAVHAPVTQTLSGTLYYQGWQHRGYFAPDKYTSLLIQSSHHEGSTGFYDTGPGFKRIHFDGASDYAEKTSVSNYRQGDDRGTVNAWVKIKDYTSRAWFCVTDTSGTNQYWGIYSNADGLVTLNRSDTISDRTINAISIGVWTMVTVTQEPNQDTKFYVDGVLYESQAVTRGSGSPSNPALVGNERWFGDISGLDLISIGNLSYGTGPTRSDYFDGHISQVAVWSASSGTNAVLTASQISAIYDLGPGGNVKTSYSPDLVDYWSMGNVTGEGDDMVTEGSTIYSQVASGQDLTDVSLSAPFAGHTITVSGPYHSTTHSVFGGSSIFFDGTNDYLQVANPPANVDFNIWAAESVDSSVEAWCYFLSNPGTTSQTIASQWPVGSPATAWEFRTDGLSLNMSVTYSGTTLLEVAGNKHGMSANRWYHCAFTKNGNLGTVLVDGIPIDSGTGTAYATVGFDDTLDIGRRAHHNDIYFHGYMDEIRISTGIGRYSKSIERFANTFVTKGDTGDAFTTFQIQSNGAKNGTGFSDGLNRTGYNTTAVVIGGNPVWRNTVGDGFGGANTALYFGSESDFISFEDSAEWDLVSSTYKIWTYELWVYHDQDTAYGAYLGQYEDASNKFHFGANDYAWGQMYSGTANNWTIQNTNIKIPTHQWVHMVFQRKGIGIYEHYMNGVLVASQHNYDYDTFSGVLKIGDAGDPSWNTFIGYMDQIRLSMGIARYGKYQLRTTQQTHVSANSDSGVITSNSTFGSANNIFTADGHTAFLFTGDEGYSNTHVTAGGNKFLTRVGNTSVSNVTTTYQVTVMASAEQLGGTSGNVFAINDFARPTLTLVRDNHYVFRGVTGDVGGTGTHPFRLNSSANGPAYTTGWVAETSGTDTLYKISPNSDTPDVLHYGCASHPNMGFSISVVDSTGSDGVIAPTPIGIRKGTGTDSTTYPVQRQGISAYGANSYFMDGTNDYLYSVPGTYGVLATDTWRDNGFCGETWIRPLTAVTKGITNFIRLDASNHLHMRFHNTHGFVVTFDSAAGQVEILQTNNDDYAKSLVDQWHHVAVQITNADKRSAQKLQLWVDGVKFTEASMSDKHFSGAGGVSLYIGLDDSNYFSGYMDSFRVSVKERYNYSGTNAKLGTNAVHHSRAKLLITSNTFSGNTHFDDFADQGNYWNQQPSSYFFDNTDSVITTPSTTLGTAHCAAAWINIGDMATDGGIFGISGSTWALHHNTDGVLVSAYNTAVYDNALGKMTTDQWHLVAVIKNGATTTNYVNGVQAATNSSAGTTAFNGAKYIGNLSASGTNWFHGRIAQVAAWNSATAISAANIQSMWEAGPTANWMTDYSTNMLQYYAMGNHNDLSGRPVDTANIVYDRSGNNFDGTVAGILKGPNKGMSIVTTGAVSHSTDRKNLGSSSIYFTGTNGTDLSVQHGGVLSTTGPFTMEWWQSSTGTSHVAFFDFRNGSYTSNMYFDYNHGGTGNKLAYNAQGSGMTLFNTPDGALGDGAWHHVVLQRDTIKFRMFFDGIELAYASGPQPTDHVNDGTDEICSAGVELTIGDNYPGTAAWKGYLDEFAMYHAAKYDPVVTGLGTSTITPSYLSDPSGNQFTPTNLAVTDQMLDTPENNFCTLNTAGYNLVAPTEGNLKVASTMNKGIFGTMAFTKGKWYHEVKGVDAYGATHARHGFFQYTGKEAYQVAQGAGAFGDYGATVNYIGADGYILGIDTDATHVNHAVVHADAAGDVFMYALDLDDPAGKCWFGVNGTWFAGNPAKGIDPPLNSSRLKDPDGTLGFPDAPWTWGHFITDNLTSTQHANFGQGDPDGENNFTDSNGRGGFRYEPPQGFLSWCTANMKDADFAPLGPNSSAGTPDKHFDTLLYTGNGAAGHKIRGLNFQPDFVWVKRRASPGVEPYIYDSVRGAGRAIYSSATSVEGNPADTDRLTSFDPGGFTLGSHVDLNTDGKTAVAWCWKAGNGTVVDSSGKINVTRSTNTDAGFTIGTYTGSQVSDDTIAHGLGKTPEMIIFKNRDATDNWTTWHKNLTAGHNLILDDTNASGASGALQSPYVDSSFIYLGGTGDSPGDWVSTNTSGERFVFYAWTGIEGYSKFGSYLGNNAGGTAGSKDGAFIYLGFKPAFFMMKGTASGARWLMYDNKRDPNNPVIADLNAHATDAENTADENAVDFLSNGVKMRDTTSNNINYDGVTYIYMAFAEMPFKYANAR